MDQINCEILIWGCTIPKNFNTVHCFWYKKQSYSYILRNINLGLGCEAFRNFGFSRHHESVVRAVNVGSRP